MKDRVCNVFTMSTMKVTQWCEDWHDNLSSFPPDVITANKHNVFFCGHAKTFFFGMFLSFFFFLKHQTTKRNISAGPDSSLGSPAEELGI